MQRAGRCREQDRSRSRNNCTLTRMLKSKKFRKNKKDHCENVAENETVGETVHSLRNKNSIGRQGRVERKSKTAQGGNEKNRREPNCIGWDKDVC